MDKEIGRYRVVPGTPVRLADIDPSDSGPFRQKSDVADALARQRKRIRRLQERLYAEHRQSLLIIFQAIDTGGKDGTIRRVFEGVNPQGCQVWPFKAPSQEERDHDFLWRYHQKVPRRGMIAVFNRSHYEDVLVARVKELVPESVWRPRYAAINDFERVLSENGTRIVKFFLHISKDEQKRRLESRLRHPRKRWKFDPADLRERDRWDSHMAAFEEAIGRCATDHAPWYIIPANRKWYRNLIVARLVADTLEEMAPVFPRPEAGLEAVAIPD